LARLEPAFRDARPQNPPGRHRRGKAFELTGTEVSEVKQAADQAARARRDHDGARVSQRLKAGGEIGGLAHHRLVDRTTAHG
jgi:hypothetical protein